MPSLGESKYASKDWIGKRQGHLTVVAFGDKSDGTRQRYFFTLRCDCGEEFQKRATEFVKDGVLVCFTCRGVNRRVPGFSTSFLTSYKARAAKKGIVFDITPDDLEKMFNDQDGKCALTGDTLTKPLVASSGMPDGHFNVSIDRINSNGGYTLDNIQLVTKRVNLAKGSMTDDEFINMCRRVTRCRKTTLR